jgi:hypothetical protein
LLRLGLSLLVAPLFPLFPVRDCPLCGHRFSGRRHWLHCAQCGFTDRKPLFKTRRQP